MQKNNIIFLIRAYNEATRILTVIDEIFQAGYHQILVVDDGSSDDTPEILQEYIDSGKIHYLRHVINRGGGAALETGFEYIRRNASEQDWEYVVTFDADGQHRIEDMSEFLETFRKQPELDLIFGSRFIVKTDSNVPVMRRLTLWGGKIFTSLISGVHLTDAHNGYRMVRVPALQKMNLTMDGMEYASEFIDQVGKYHLRFTEVPVNIHYDEYTLGKGQRFGGPVRIVLRMIYKKFF
ncbi:MAG: glycosyltransferase family 2 protein [Candidatus Gracilibacteria bacterium]|nr:glycosyltransferase family 2 protein [Candidatus Gracilibacteria bacterium]